MGIINKMPQGSNKTISGDIALYNTSGTRDGYLLCDGSAILQTNYPKFKDKLIEGIQYQEGTVTSSLDRYVTHDLGYASNDEWLIIGGETSGNGSYTGEGAFVFNKLTAECKLLNRNAGGSYAPSQDILFPYYVGGKFYIGTMSGSYYEYDPINNKCTLITVSGYPSITTSYYGFAFGSGRIDGSDYAYVTYTNNGSTFYFYHTLDGITWYSGTALETRSNSMGKIIFDTKNEKAYYTKSDKVYSYSVVGPTITEIPEITGTLIGIYDGMFVVLADNLIKAYEISTYEEICSFFIPREYPEGSSGAPEYALVGKYVITATAWNGDYVYLVPIYKARQYKGVSNIKNYATITTDMTDYDGLLNLPNDMKYIIWRDSSASSSYANTNFNILDSTTLLDTYILPNINPVDGPYYGYIKT